MSKMKNSVIGDFKKIIRLSGKNGSKYFLLVILSSITYGLSVPLFAFFSKYMVDYALTGDRNNLYIGLVVLTIMLLLFSFKSVIGYFIDKRAYIIGMDIKRKMFSHFIKLPITYFEKNHSGDTIARINGDTDLFLKSLNMVLSVTSNFVTSVIMIPTILVLDIRLGILAIIVGTLTAYINKKFRVPIRKQNEKLRIQIGSVISEIVENISGFKVIKTYNLQKHFKKQFDDKQIEVIKIQKKNIKYNSFLYSSNNLIFQLNNSAVIIYGTYLIILGSLTIGALVALRQLALRIGYLLINTTEDISKVQDAFAGCDRVVEFLNESIEENNINIEGTLSKSLICLEDIKFSYVEGVKVLNGISIDIKKGENIALVGYSGHGKSTIVKLLLGLYDINTGKYSFEGRSVNQFSKKYIREKISYVSQNATVFNGTIKENILLGKLNATMEEIIDAAKKAHADEFIQDQVNKYDTIVGERGVKLSGGQRQRVALARAILKNGDILILDEATSSLDSKSEEYIKDSLNKFMKGRTNIIIAHRLSTVEKSDMIYFIEEGEVKEKGTHKQLLESNGRYTKLYYKDFI